MGPCIASSIARLGGRRRAIRILQQWKPYPATRSEGRNCNEDVTDEEDGGDDDLGERKHSDDFLFGRNDGFPYDYCCIIITDDGDEASPTLKITEAADEAVSDDGEEETNKSPSRDCLQWRRSSFGTVEAVSIDWNIMSSTKFPRLENPPE